MRRKSEEHSDVDKETGRLEALSDGVIAIAITLLVLDIRVPQIPAPITNGALGRADLYDWPGYAAFVTSFCTIFIMWVHHHTVFRLLKRVDSKLIFANGLLLLIISFNPFPTALLARYFATPGANMACHIYSGMLLVNALSFKLWLHAALRKPLLDPSASEAALNRLRRSYSGGPLIYVVAFIASFFNAWLCMGICTAAWVYWTVVTLEKHDTPAEKGETA